MYECVFPLPSLHVVSYSMLTFLEGREFFSLFLKVTCRQLVIVFEEVSFCVFMVQE